MLVTDVPEKSPGVCFMCEGAEPGAKFLRTDRFYTLGHLAGVKYICSYCVRSFAEEFGLFDAIRADYEAALSGDTVLIADLQEKLGAYEHLGKAIETLSKPAPVRKAPARKK